MIKKIFKNFHILQFVLISTLLFPGCNGKDKQNEINSKTAVAKVYDEIITIGDLDRTLKSMPDQMRLRYSNLSMLKYLVQLMIDWKLISKKAIKDGVTDQLFIKKKLEELSGASKLEKEKFITEFYIQKLKDNIGEVKDEDAKKYYKEHAYEFKIPESAYIKRIVFEKQSEAENFLKMFDGNMSFEMLMKRYPNLEGKIEFLRVQKRKESTDLDLIPFNLIKNSVSKVIKTGDKYCIIQVKEKKPSAIRKFEEVKEIIKNILKNQMRSSLPNKISKEVRINTPFTINVAVIESYFKLNNMGKKIQ